MHEVKLNALTVQGEDYLAVVDMTDGGAPLRLPPPTEEPLLAHRIIIPAAAVGARMVMYDLASPEEALDAILREHLARLASDIATPQTRAEAVERMKSDIGALKVTRPRKVEALVELGALIEEARAARIPRRRPQEEE